MKVKAEVEGTLNRRRNKLYMVVREENWERYRKIYLIVSTFSMKQKSSLHFDNKENGGGENEEKRDNLTERTRNSQSIRK